MLPAPKRRIKVRKESVMIKILEKREVLVSFE